MGAGLTRDPFRFAAFFSAGAAGFFLIGEIMAVPVRIMYKIYPLNKPTSRMFNREIFGKPVGLAYL
jgi:hypothetical protein